MVNKLLVLVALISSGMACQCSMEDAETLSAFQPSQALDIFKGFLHGIGLNECAYTNCYINATYDITQIQYIINQAEILIHNFDYQGLLRLACGGINFDLSDLYRICDVQALINSFQIFTTTAGLEQVAKNFLYQIGVFKEAFEHISACSSDYDHCGYDIGASYRILSGYGMPNVTTVSTEEFNAYQGDVTGFFNGIIDGLDCPYLRAFREELSTFITYYALLLEGDLTGAEAIVETYKVLLDRFHGIKVPKLTTDKILELYEKNEEFIQESLKKLETCEEYDCGIIVGKVLDLAF